MEVLAELKILEQSLDMVTVRIDAKTVKSLKRETGDARQRRRRLKKRETKDGFFDFALEEFFDDFDCGDAAVF